MTLHLKERRWKLCLSKVRYREGRWMKLQDILQHPGLILEALDLIEVLSNVVTI